ncbi:MAG: DUF4058 family protein [Planctomycetota bacterium]
MAIHDWTRVPAGIFHHFHHEWISAIMRSLNQGVLPAGFYALEEQVTGGLGPDVLTLKGVTDAKQRHPGSTNPQADHDDGGVSLATAPPKVRFTAETEMDRFARRRNRVVIRHVSGHEVVAIIEIISPGNKASHHGIQSFVNKTTELLAAGIHLLIMDLFPPGSRDPQGIHGEIWSAMEDDCFQLPDDAPLTLVAYSADDVKQAFIEPVAVGGVLPDMPLFIRPSAYVLVPLEETYQAAFEGVPQVWREQLA